MKKLLSLLTILTLTTSVPSSLLANTVQTRVKRDVSTLTSNSNNNYLPIKQINEVNDKVQSITVDSKNNIYFGTNNGAYKLSVGSDTPTKINGINDYVYSLAVDSKDNIYFGINSGFFVLKQGAITPTKINGVNGISAIAININNDIYLRSDSGLFVLKQGKTKQKKIKNISNINSLTVDSKDNIYFGSDNGVFVLKQGAITPTKINGINHYVYSLAVDSKDNIYFGISNGIFVLKKGETTPTKINGISTQINSLAVDSKDNIYFGTDNGAFILQTALSWVKTQSQFTLVDSSKTKTWTRPDLIAVDGELNIDIVNPNIDKVVFDNVEQPQTSKQWKINVKPELAPRDHNLQVMFTLNGKQYTSEIIVSIQAKIDPTSTPVQKNLSNLIKTTDLGNIIDNNDDTIFTAVNQKNGNIIDDFSQIEITKKNNNSGTLIAKSDSKSYTSSVDVNYNVVPTTTVDLKIDVTPTSSKATVIKDYLGQIDTSNLTNPVNTFYYANSESKITMVKPTPSSVITGVVYGCDDKWNKISQPYTIDPINGIKLDGSQLATNDGKYVVELSDNLGHTNNVYLQINEDIKDIKEYWNTDNGKQFEMWAKANGYDNIRGSSVSQLNKLFAESKNWQQLASDSQFASAIADWFKTNGKLVSKEPLTKEQVTEQLKLQIPNDIKIPAVNTSNYDVNKVSFELNQSEFKPNDKVNITVKYNNATAEQFTLQIKDSNAPNNKKGGDSKLWIIGVVVGVLAGLGLAYLFFKRFVFDKYIYPKIIARRHNKLVEQVIKEEAEKEVQNNKRGEE